MRGALRFLLHLAQHLAASQHWAHLALGFLRLFGHTLNVNNFLAGAEREESLEFFLFSFFFVFDFAYDALATCLLDDVHSLNNREKQRSGTKCTQWELCRHTTHCANTLSLSRSASPSRCLCRVRPLSLALSRIANMSNRFALNVFSCLVVAAADDAHERERERESEHTR